MTGYLSKLWQRSLYTIQEAVDRTKYKAGYQQPTISNFDNHIGNPNQLKGRDRPMYAKHKLQKLGWKDFQAAAIVGNLMQESFSSLRSDIWGDRGTAFGIAQWRNGRLVKLRALADSKRIPLNDLDLQIEYVDWELRNTEKSVGDRLLLTNNLEDAMKVAIAYERPRGYTKDHPENGDGYKQRLAYAESLM